jgi:hypothetical protein
MTIMKVQKRDIPVLVFSVTLALALACPQLVPAAPPAAVDRDQPDAGKVEAELVKALKAADVVFTAKVGKVDPLGQTNSIPASIFGKVTFKDLKAIQGALPKGATFSYSYREGMAQHLDLVATGQVLVAVKKDSVSAVVAATDANMALAKKTLGEEKK